MARLSKLGLQFGAMLAGLLVTAYAGPLRAQTNWDLNRGNCGSVLSSPTAYSLDDIRRCAQRWAAYGSPDAIAQTDAQQYARGFSRLYYEGTSTDQSMAQTALSQLGQQMLPRDQVVPDQRLEAFLARNTSPIQVVDAGDRAHRAARDHNSDGMRAYQHGDYDTAARDFQQALDADPFYTNAKYNLVCQLALLGRTDDAIQQLDELSRWNSQDAHDHVAHATTDGDLASLRSDVRFRIITGQASVQLLDGGGAAGLQATQQIHDALVAAGLDVASYGYDRWPRARPLIWYKRGFENVANQVQQIVASDQTRSRLMDFPSDYDVVVVYGAIDATAVPRPRVQGLLRVDGGDPQQAVNEVADDGVDVVNAAENPAQVPDAATNAVQEWVPPP